MIEYAIGSDLAAWINPESVPATADRLLRSATLVIARAANRNPYTDAPSADEAPPLRDATCAQVASWIALGVDPAKLGVGGPSPVKSSKILTGSIDYDTTAQAKALASLAESELVPEAQAILQSAGLLWLPVPIGADPCDPLPSWGQASPWPAGWGADWANEVDGYGWDSAGYFGPLV